MKVFFSLILLCTLVLATTAAVLYNTPHKIYRAIVERSEYPSFYVIKRPLSELLAPGSPEILEWDVRNPANSSDFWQKYYLGRYLVPLPSGNVAYKIIPVIQFKDFYSPPELGVKIVNHLGEEILSMVIKEKTIFPRGLSDQELFKVPVFQDELRSLSTEVIWRDLFLREIKRDEREYADMVYSLYIMHLRSKFFPKDIKEFFYDGGAKKAVVVLTQKRPHTKRELIYMPLGGLVHQVEITTKISEPEALAFREIILRGLDYDEYSRDIAETVARDFKSLSYLEQLGQLGVLTLFSAWSQKTQEKEFLQETIKFLERGKGNFDYLRPFYDYGFARFKSSFSARDGNEGEDERLKRKIREEQEKELEELRKKNLPIDEMSFPSTEAQIDYFLKKGKEAKQEEDEDDSTLTLD